MADVLPDYPLTRPLPAEVLVGGDALDRRVEGLVHDAHRALAEHGNNVVAPEALDF